MALPTDDGAAEFVDLGEQAFDLSAPAISAQRAPILRDGFGSVGTMRCDQFDALFSERLIEWIAVVGKIPDKSSRSSHGKGLIQGCLHKGDFMRRSTSRVHGEWKTRSDCNNHELQSASSVCTSRWCRNQRLQHCSLLFGFAHPLCSQVSMHLGAQCYMLFKS